MNQGNLVTYLQAIQLIDQAAQDNRLYHHNGGQAYIKLSDTSDILLIVDHSSIYDFTVTMMDGSAYFQTYEGAQYQHSKRMREFNMVEWYDNYIKELQGV
jgi:hypothetical protein